ncbi:glycosyl hydrolase [Massilia violaceinigra]|uniref:Glycosyl hydrolase n=1 Tax=Massilia violaceinigra TaxID=2045208 RepID=A0A2D2DP23_9BURK|nr:family 43 glycosylhydrolase [Massilia violaceinigra]ATQ76733.1 glycosyl hydrolase [Massilia violaceinigra]
MLKQPVIPAGRLAACVAALLLPVLAGAASTTFINPVGPSTASSADPHVMRHSDGNYYFVSTAPGWDKLELRKSPSLSGIGARTPVTVFVKTAACSGNNCTSKEIWAPEINHINGAWYIYFSGAGTDNQHRVFAIRNPSADPTTGTWSAPVKVADSEDSWAIDQTVANINGQLYMAWSDISGGQPQRIKIARMSSPTTLIGKGAIISTPTLVWEKSGAAVNEAPAFIVHGNKVHLSISASGCWTDDYKLGLLTANLGADLTMPSNWSKAATPILQKGNGAFGPGHNGFTKSPDGTEDWIVYHANPATGQGCGDSRTTRIQKVSWNGDIPVIGAPVAAGMPVTRPSGEGSGTIWYRVRNEASGKVMSIDRAAAANGAAIWQFTNLNNSDQLWSLDPVDGAWFKLTSNYNGNVVDVAGHSTAPGVAVKTQPYGATHNQQWQLVPGTTQHVGVRNRNSSLMLDNRDGSLLDGAVIQQWSANGLAPQRWRLERAN